MDRNPVAISSENARTAGRRAKPSAYRASFGLRASASDDKIEGRVVNELCERADDLAMHYAMLWLEE
jgi:hypothetical protein